jgi:hypothetical protein
VRRKGRLDFVSVSKNNPAAAARSGATLLFTICFCAAGCAADRRTERAEAPLVVRTRQAPVEAEIVLDPPTIRYDRDTLLTVRLTAPTNMPAQLPDMADRFDGMILNGVFDGEPVIRNGLRILTRHARFTPELAPEYRLKPLVIRYGPATGDDMSWFTTTPVVLDAVPPVSGSVPGDIDADLQPLRVYPPPRVVAIWAGLAAVVLGAIVALLVLGRRISHHVEIMRMSPGERALRELRLLVARHLPEKDQVKTFYVELTMIVRRYIERQHGIHAPEQTTEEFLHAISCDRRFAAEVLTTLKNFLEAADLVKFAAFHPERDANDRATETARTYIKTDSRLQQDKAAERRG